MSTSVPATPVTGPLAFAARIIALLESLPLSILQLLMRISLASVFWSAGMVKIASWQTTLVLFRDEYKVPFIPFEPAAYMAAATELSMPVLLLFGLATRLATLPLLGMTAVIEIFVYPEDWVIHLTWAAMLLLILTRGPGAISIDHLIRQKFLPRR